MNFKPEQDPYQPIAEIEAIINQIPPQNIGEAITAVIIFARGENPQHNIPGVENLLQGIKEEKFNPDDILNTLESKYHLQYSLGEAQNTSKNTPADQQKRIKIKIGKTMMKSNHRTLSKKGTSLMKTSYTQAKLQKKPSKKTTPVSR